MRISRAAALPRVALVATPVTAAHHSPMRGHDRPMFRCGEQAPYNFLGSRPTVITGVAARAGARCTSGSAGRWLHRGLPVRDGGALPPVQAHDLALERPALDGELAEVEV